MDFLVFSIHIGCRLASLLFKSPIKYKKKNSHKTLQSGHLKHKKKMLLINILGSTQKSQLNSKPESQNPNLMIVDN